MSEQTAEYARASLVPTKDVEEAPWNCNVMPPGKFEALKADMKAAGPKGTDPIHTCRLDGKRYTCDGAQRLRAAKQLGWLVLYEYFHPEIITEEQARLFNYKRDAERGDIDPFKLAASFKWFVDRGFKQEEIAEKYGVDKSTVSHRLSLLNVDVEIREQVVTDTRMGVSHLEPIATLPAALQSKALEEVRSSNRWDRTRPITVREVAEAVQKVKQDDAKKQAFEKLLKDPRIKDKFRKCPECKSDPVEAVTDRWYLWPGAVLVVQDQHCHRWSLITGPQPKARTTSSRRGSSGSSRPPQHEKSRVKSEVYVQAVRNLFDAVWPRITEVDSLEWTGATSKDKTEVSLSGKDLRYTSIGGKLDGKKVSLDINIWASGQADIQFGNVDFKFERNATANKSFETYVRTSGTLLTRKALHDLEDAAVDFVEEYGGLPRTKNPDFARIEKRKARK
jgi:ParB-like chromosome segregation protein Spo0J